MNHTLPYIGRFAPSPSGPLHFGSLVAALGSYLQAKASQGKWLLRIEDIDPPREVKGAASRILSTLDQFGLHWDGEVLYQSSRLEAYQAQIEQWLADKEAYYCHCTRQQIKAAGGIYSGLCRNKMRSANNAAVRVCIDDPISQFEDIKQGQVSFDAKLAAEDFIIKRRDGLFAYNLAVVLDDIYQGVTQVVRGADLLEPTTRQLSLYQKLNAPFVSYLHLPLAITASGAKLSKQNHAPAVDNKSAVSTLFSALTFLNMPVPVALQRSSVPELLTWGIENWQITQLPDNNKVICAFENEQP